MALPEGVKRNPLPSNYIEKAHRRTLEKQIVAKLKGTDFEGYEVFDVDVDAGYAYIAKLEAWDGVIEYEKHDFKEGTKPKNWERFEARLRLRKPDWEILSWQPHAGANGVAYTALLDGHLSRTRQALAQATGVQPWDIKIEAMRGPDLSDPKKRTLVRYEIVFPIKYNAKHLPEIERLVYEVLGNLGWSVDISEYGYTGKIWAGHRPEFAKEIPRPIVPESEMVWDQIPFGEGLTDAEAVWYLSHSPHLGVSGKTRTGKGVTIQQIILGALLRKFELALIDPVKLAVDYPMFRPYVREGGWGGQSLVHAATAIGLVYEEGKRRTKILRRHAAANWQMLPDDAEQFDPILVVVDEASVLFNFKRLPPGIDKESDAAIRLLEENMLRYKILDFAERIAAEQAFVGVHLIFAGQKLPAKPFASVKVNLGARILTGNATSPGDRTVALQDPNEVPRPPTYIAEDKIMSKGVGMFEPGAGGKPMVYKSYFESNESMKESLAHLPSNDDEFSIPTSAQISRIVYEE